MPANEIDQFFDLFLQESADRFDELDQHLVLLEEDPANEELLYAILRNVHSLKGSAGMFGCDGMKVVGHRLEDLMELAHARPETVDREVMDLLFEGRDILQGVLQRFTETGAEGEAFTPRERAFLEHLEAVYARLSATGLEMTEAVGDLLTELDELLPTMNAVWDVKRLERQMEQVRTLLQRNETETSQTVAAAGVAWLGEIEITRPLRRLEGLLDRAQREPLSDSDASQAFADLGAILKAAGALALPSLEEMLKEGNESIEIFSELELEFDALQSEYYLGLLGELGPYVTATVGTTGGATEEAGIEDDRPLQRARKTVRIDEAKVDAFLDNIGELIILSEVFNNLQKRLERTGGDLRLLRELKGANADFAAHVFTLQNALMEVRRVELRNVTGSLARLVRDTAQQLEKKIEFALEGEDAVLDKSLLDDVNTCLVHLVRNAVDHGIEPPAEREADGKPALGRVEVIASNEDGFLLLKVRDDGRGLNVARLRERASAQGLLSASAAQALTDREVMQLIFNDGLSTAQQVSDVSGRGVGMGVVLENIRGLGGSVEVDSNLGRGTEVTLRVPLTVMLSVVDGLVVRVGEAGFVVPIRYVEESVHPERDQITGVHGKGECIRLRGRIFPLKRLRALFEYPPTRTPGGTDVGVLVRSDRGELCLLADEILDHQQVVIKEIEGLGKIPGIRGGALLGDGTIGLVLDIDAITAQAL